MLPEVVWAMPEHGTFNLHASLLPQYRGAAPINWAVINGEEETGITTFFLTHEIDTGDIIMQEREAIGPDDTVGEVYERLMRKGAGLVLQTVDRIAKGTAPRSPQVMSGAYKPAPKITKEDCAIDFGKTTREVRNLIRGMSPYPAAWTELQGKRLKIYAAEAVLGTWPFDTKALATDGKTFLAFQTLDVYIKATDLQLEGKKRMLIDEFLRGFQL
jgi:methionyl-tRNA formyltransferase